MSLSMLLQDCLAAAAAAALSTVTGVHPRAVARRGVRGATVELWVSDREEYSERGDRDTS